MSCDYCGDPSHQQDRCPKLQCKRDELSAMKLKDLRAEAKRHGVRSNVGGHDGRTMSHIVDDIMENIIQSVVPGAQVLATAVQVDSMEYDVDSVPARCTAQVADTYMSPSLKDVHTSHSEHGSSRQRNGMERTRDAAPTLHPVVCTGFAFNKFSAAVVSEDVKQTVQQTVEALVVLTKSDVVTITEVSTAPLEHLKEVLRSFGFGVHTVEMSIPGRRTHASRGHNVVAWSLREFNEISRPDFEVRADMVRWCFPAVHLRCRFTENDIVVVGAHVTPNTPSGVHDQLLTSMEENVSRIPFPTVVLGDLNAQYTSFGTIRTRDPRYVCAMEPRPERGGTAMHHLKQQPNAVGAYISDSLVVRCCEAIVLDGNKYCKMIAQTDHPCPVRLTIELPLTTSTRELHAVTLYHDSASTFGEQRQAFVPNMCNPQHATHGQCVVSTNGVRCVNHVPRTSSDPRRFTGASQEVLCAAHEAELAIGTRSNEDGDILVLPTIATPQRGVVDERSARPSTVVFISPSGTTFHKTNTCRGAKGMTETTQQEAEASGRRACTVCKPLETSEETEVGRVTTPTTEIPGAEVRQASTGGTLEPAPLSDHDAGAAPVFLSRTGICFHKHDTCGAAKGMTATTRQEAEALGRRACKICMPLDAPEGIHAPVTTEMPVAALSRARTGGALDRVPASGDAADHAPSGADGTTLVFLSQTGICFHKHDTCRAAKGMTATTRQEAEALGRRACKICMLHAEATT